MIKQTVYLDNCCFNRPYDDQSHLSIYIETQAKLAIQELVKDKELLLIWSFIMDYENSKNPDVVVKNEIFTWRKLSTTIVYSDNQLIENAQKISQLGFGKKDALHLASAIKEKVKYFITVDKGILRKRKAVEKLTILSPIEFIQHLEK